MLSYWIESTQKTKENFKSLEENQEADICIIGGGITGLSIAYYLSKTNLKTVVLEKTHLCEHTTR